MITREQEAEALKYIAENKDALYAVKLRTILKAMNAREVKRLIAEGGDLLRGRAQIIGEILKAMG
jgi:hypothetical protein